MHLIDTHCHLTFEELSSNIEEVLNRSRQADVTKWITVGTDSEQNQQVAQLAEKYENIFAAVGIHPHHAKEVTNETIRQLEQLAQKDKIIAIGETGLDFHYNYSEPDIQKKIFIQHLEIAKQFQLPVIIHSREAFDETMEILDEFASGLKKIVIHCFSGDADQAKIVLDKGYYISFTGVVTFKNAETARQAAKIVPLDRLMIETDCPFMSPAPMRKQKINEPALMIHTAKFLADLKNIPLEDFAAQVSKTSEEFFGI